MTVMAMNPSEAAVTGAVTQAAVPWNGEPTPMSAEAFLGQWKDSIGHDVTVKISEGLLIAILTKPEGGKPKELCIHMDHCQHWRCGNGVLHDSQGLVYHKDSKQGQPLALSWVTWNGKMSKWTRCADVTSTPARDAEKWWKMTEEWESEEQLPKMIQAKMRGEDDKDADRKAQVAAKTSRRKERGGRANHQWRKVVECEA